MAVLPSAAPKLCERVDETACGLEEMEAQEDIDLLALVHAEAEVEANMDDDERGTASQELAVDDSYTNLTDRQKQAASKVVECIRCQFCPVFRPRLLNPAEDPDEAIVRRS